MTMRKHLNRMPAWVFSSNEDGQGLVETAVALSLFSLILLGVAEMGQVAYTSIEVSNAAKAGVQYGAQSGYTAPDSTGIQNAAAAEAPNLSGLIATPSTSCICSNGSPSSCGNGDCSTSHIEEILTVNTQYTLTPMIRLPALPSSFTLRGQAVQKVLQ